MDDQAVVVMPTEWKTKLPQTLSYPVGAELLSKAFSGVPQFDKLRVRFWFYQKMRPERADRYAVLEIRYSRAAKSVHTRPDDTGEDGLPKIAWGVTVRPVPRGQRSAIRKQLLDKALPEARVWLESNAGRDEVGGSGLVYTYDQDSGLISVTEETRLEPRRR